MRVAARLAGIIAVASTGVAYGTDAFCALVQRLALARVGDAGRPGLSCRAWQSPQMCVNLVS